MPAYVSMFIAIILWSLYPLVTSKALETMVSWDLIIAVMAAAYIGALLIAIPYLKHKKILGKAINIQRNLPSKAYVMLALSGISGVLCNSFFFWALDLAHKGGVSLLYEAWPVIAVIASPMLMRKAFKEVNFKEFLIAIIALVGVAIIILSDKEINFNVLSNNLSQSPDYSVIGGYILAFAGAYMVAINAVSQAAYSEFFSDLKDDFGATLINQVMGRGVSMIFAFILYLIFTDSSSSFVVDWPPVIFIGFGILILGTSFYTFGLLKSDKPTIHILYYFVPLLAVIWLWMAGETTISLGLVVGGAIILGSNVYLAYANRNKAPLPVAGS